MRSLFVVLMVLLLASACRPSGTVAPSAVPTEKTLTFPIDQLSGALFDPPRVLADFSADATTGDTFTLSEHRGEIILLYFGYRACPDFCPTTFSDLKWLYGRLNEPSDQLKIVFVTVDPERDTLELLSTYTRAFHQDFIGLRAEGEALQQIMDQFGAVAEKQQLGDSPLSYLVDHTASMFLIGPDGRLYMQYLYGTDYQAILSDLQIILTNM